VADTHGGYYQVELDENSRRLTTFITPWSRYQYCHTPMGHCSAGDAYTKRLDDAIQDLPRKYKCVDDTLLHDLSVEEAFWHTYDFLEMSAKAGVTLKLEKFSSVGRRPTSWDSTSAWTCTSPRTNVSLLSGTSRYPRKPPSRTCGHGSGSSTS